jgi:hypothetical protein
LIVLKNALQVYCIYLILLNKTSEVEALQATSS